MSGFLPLPELPDDFRGIVRLFPLPGVTIFPGTLRPLRVFEPRYCALLSESLAGDRLIAMATLLPGWESDYFGAPPIAPVVCLGRVLFETPDEVEGHRIVLAGVARARIVEELPDTSPFRRARVVVLADQYRDADIARRGDLQRRLLDHVRRWVPEATDPASPWSGLFEDGLPLGRLTDVLAQWLACHVSVKQQLLAECDVHQRAEMLLELLESLPPPSTFPPDFSSN